MRRVTAHDAIKRKYPEWIVLLVTIDPAGKVNVMPSGWSMVTSFEPPMYAVSVGHARYSHEMIESTGEFTVAVPGPEMGNSIRYCGTRSGRDGDKLPGSGLVITPAEQVRTPLIEGAVANLECRLVNQLDTGDHTIFVGQVLAAHVADEQQGRLLNFAPGLYAQAQPVPGSEFRFKP